MVQEALRGLKESLALDGYLMSIQEGADGFINVTIEIEPDACAECLMPPDVLESIIAGELSEKGIPFTQINVSIPKV